jgi:hypothetical protein
VLLGDLDLRLVTGSSWVDIEAILDRQVSDTTLRARRDEWIAAGVFDQLKDEAMAAFDRVIGLDLGEVSLDGSLHKAPYGGEGTGPNPTDRAKLGWKWSVASDRHGIPSAGPSTAPTAATSACSSPRSTPWSLSACWSTSTRCTSTGAMTTRWCASASPHSAWTTWTSSPRHQGARHEAAGATRPALDRRGHQLLVVELRPTPTQHRPPTPAPPCSALPGHHRAHRRQAPCLPRPMERRMSTYPLRSLGSAATTSGSTSESTL